MLFAKKPVADIERAFNPFSFEGHIMEFSFLTRESGQAWPPHFDLEILIQAGAKVPQKCPKFWKSAGQEFYPQFSFLCCEFQPVAWFKQARLEVVEIGIYQLNLDHRLGNEVNMRAREGCGVAHANNFTELPWTGWDGVGGSNIQPILRRAKPNCVARWQNLIPSFPWIVPGWRAWGAIRGKEGIKFCSAA